MPHLLPIKENLSAPPYGAGHPKLSDKENQRLFLFGGGPKEITQLKQWADMFPNTISIAGTCNMNQELALMSHLDIMLSMDSGNMHLASLVGTPVISIWGATHPLPDLWVGTSISTMLYREIYLAALALYSGTSPATGKTMLV